MSTPIHTITDHQWATMMPAAIAALTGTTARNVHNYRSRHKKPAAPTKRGRPAGPSEKPYNLTPAAVAQRAVAAQSAGRKAGEIPHRSTLYRRAKRASAHCSPDQ